MHKKFETNRTKIKGGCQSERKVVTHNSDSDLPLYVVLFEKITPYIFGNLEISGDIGGPVELLGTTFLTSGLAGLG